MQLILSLLNHPAVGAALFLAGVMACGSQCFADDPFKFVDVADEWGLAKPLKGSMAHAVACGDINGDGTPDLYIGTFCDRQPEEYIGRGQAVPNLLFLSKDGKYENTTTQPLAIDLRTSGAVFADFDNDGDLDLFVSINSKKRKKGTLNGHNRLFENVDGVLKDVSKDNQACVIMGGRSVGVLDYDGDRLLDILVLEDSWNGGMTKLFRNRGKLNFEETTAVSGLPMSVAGLAVITADLNLDGWPDIFISKSNKLFLSTGNGTYTAVDSSAFKHNLVPRSGTFPCGAACGDVDRDGDLDLVTVDHVAGSGMHLYLNGGIKDGLPQYREVTQEFGLSYRFPGKTPSGLYLRHDHVAIEDFDNDGWPDILVAAVWEKSGKPQPFVCRNLGLKGGRILFETPPVEKVMAHQPAGPVADFDRDGRLDMLLLSWFPTVPTNLFLNRSPQRHWLQVKVEGKTINRMGIGCKVRIYRAGKLGIKTSLIGYNEILIDQGYCTGSENIVHFGLGDESVCDLEVILPHGKGRIERKNIKADQLLTLSEE